MAPLRVHDEEISRWTHLGSPIVGEAALLRNTPEGATSRGAPCALGALA